MIKKLLKQTSFLMLSFVLGTMSVHAGEADWDSVIKDAKSMVDSTKFFKSKQSKKDIWEIAEDLGWSLGATKENDAYKEIKDGFSDIKGNGTYNKYKNSINQIKNQAEQSLNTFKQGAQGTASTFSGDALNAVKNQIVQDAKQMAKDGGGVMRKIKERVSKEMDEMADKTSETGSGMPTMDPANVTVAIFNMDSVFKADQSNGGVRKQDTKACSTMGKSGAEKSANLALECCMEWMMMSEEEEPADSNGKKASGFADKIALCCGIAPEYCIPMNTAKEKADCMNGEMSKGASMEESWKTCEVECGETDYGELVHNEKEEYDAQQVEDLMKECYDTEEDKWQPSPTVLTASEMAPVVPEEVKGLLK